MDVLRAQLIERLRGLGVEHRPAPGRNDGFAGLCYDNKSFAHFHSDHELDIRLTKKVIEREGLKHPPDSRVHPARGRKSQWIEVRFNSSADLERVVRLVELAIDQL